MNARAHRPRAGRRPRLEVSPLEDRVSQSVAGLSASASPMVLRHLNPQNQPHPTPSDGFVPVTISGMFVGTLNSRPRVAIQVFDELGRRDPSRLLTPMVFPTRNAPNVLTFTYSTRVGIPLARPGSDPNGRQFTVFVTAFDADNAVTASTVVTVPRRVFPTLRNPDIIHPQ